MIEAHGSRAADMHTHITAHAFGRLESQLKGGLCGICSKLECAGGADAGANPAGGAGIGDGDPGEIQALQAGGAGGLQGGQMFQRIEDPQAVATWLMVGRRCCPFVHHAGEGCASLVQGRLEDVTPGKRRAGGFPKRAFDGRFQHRDTCKRAVFAPAFQQLPGLADLRFHLRRETGPFTGRAGIRTHQDGIQPKNCQGQIRPRTQTGQTTFYANGLTGLRDTQGGCGLRSHSSSSGPPSRRCAAANRLVTSSSAL